MKAASAVLLLLSLFPGTSHSQSLFDGTWIIGASKDEDFARAKPIVFLVSDGVFRYGDRVLKVDGTDQKVPPTGYWDTVSVRIVDDHTVELISRKGGKAMYAETDSVSADGNRLTQVVKDMTEAESVTLESVYKRVAPVPPNAHVLSGTWQVFKQSRSQNSTVISYKCTAEGFSAWTPLGERLDAKFDGKFYMMEDDPGHTMVSVKMINPRTIEQTNKRDGKIVFLVRLEVAPDGKTIHASSKSAEDGSTHAWELYKKLN